MTRILVSLKDRAGRDDATHHRDVVGMIGPVMMAQGIYDGPYKIAHTDGMAAFWMTDSQLVADITRYMIEKNFPEVQCRLTVPRQWDETDADGRVTMRATEIDI